MVPHNSNILHDYSIIVHPGMDIDTIHHESLSRVYVCVSIAMVKAQKSSITKALTSVALRSLPYACHLIPFLFASPTAANSLKPCMSHPGMFSCIFPSIKSNAKPTLEKDGVEGRLYVMIVDSHPFFVPMLEFLLQ